MYHQHSEPENKGSMPIKAFPEDKTTIMIVSDINDFNYILVKKCFH